jgi:hypothetical protein
MIYTRWGSKIKICINCGQHQPQEFRAPITLLRVKHIETQEFDYQFAEFLRADKGYNEILQAIEVAETEILTGRDLKKALRKAS